MVLALALIAMKRLDELAWEGALEMRGKGRDLSVLEIRAAGGLVWRSSPRGREVAVIHRARHGDWTLPKGKLEPGEDWHEAAVREVAEETGCQVKLCEPAGRVCYTVGDKPKQVRYWNMELLVGCQFEPTEEVDRVVWMTVQEAVERLDYQGERALLLDNQGDCQINP
jgi:8-oxo-dGTP pyrophosphatase MutT (NUDIX family)